MSDHYYINTKYKLISLYYKDSLSSSLKLVPKRSCLKKGRITLQFPTLARPHTFTLRLWEYENLHMSGRHFTDLKNVRGYFECRKKISSGTFLMKHIHVRKH